MKDKIQFIINSIDRFLIETNCTNFYIGKVCDHSKNRRSQKYGAYSESFDIAKGDTGAINNLLKLLLDHYKNNTKLSNKKFGSEYKLHSNANILYVAFMVPAMDFNKHNISIGEEFPIIL